MGFEPRARGRRFGRQVAKKKTARERREQQEPSIAYEEHSPIDPARVRSVTLNDLEHLGNQLFPLPPYSEHFERWMKDITAVLSDFENQLPKAADEQFKEKTNKTMSNLRAALAERTIDETRISNMAAERQRQLTASENQLIKLDSEYKTTIHQMRRSYDQSFEKLRQEIDTLGDQRLRLLNSRPSLLQRLLGRSHTKLEEKTSVIQLKKNDLGDRKKLLNADLERKRIEYENQRRLLKKRLISLQSEVEGSDSNKLDDALEIRKRASEELRRDVSETVDRLLKAQETASSQ